MKKRTMLMLVISIISVLGASTLVYNALAPDNVDLNSEITTTALSDTTTSELTTAPTTVSETNASTFIDGVTNKTAPDETTAIPSPAPKAGTTVTAPAPPAAKAPAATTNATKPTVKGNAPDFSVYDSSGNTVKLSDYLGKAVVLNFWASWCPPCKAEMPEFQKMYAKYSGQNIAFLMINMTDGSRETQASANSYVSSNGFTFPILFDTKQSASSAYGISSIPDTIFITRDGNISRKIVGQVNGSTLESEIEKLLK